MTELTQQVKSILDSNKWEYTHSGSENSSYFGLSYNSKIRIRIDILDDNDTDKSDRGYEISFIYDELIPTDFIARAALIANRLNIGTFLDYSALIRCVIYDNGHIIFIAGRNIINRLNEEDFLLDLATARDCCVNFAPQIIAEATDTANIDWNLVGTFIVE